MKIDILFWCIIVYIVTYSFSLRLKLKDTLQNDNEEYLFTINVISPANAVVTINGKI